MKSFIDSTKLIEIRENEIKERKKKRSFSNILITILLLLKF